MDEQDADEPHDAVCPKVRQGVSNFWTLPDGSMHPGQKKTATGAVFVRFSRNFAHTLIAEYNDPFTFHISRR